VLTYIGASFLGRVARAPCAASPGVDAPVEGPPTVARFSQRPRIVRPRKTLCRRPQAARFWSIAVTHSNRSTRRRGAAPTGRSRE
jgi:hypothetical protein